MTALIVILQIVFVIITLMLCFVILIQPARGEGIASAFAGVGAESFFGTRAHQHMSRATIVLAVILLLLGILINRLGRAAPEPSGENEPTPTRQQEK